MTDSVEYVWHYTTMTKLDPILTDQRLNPSTLGLLDNETPVLWFSANQQWEQTANKAGTLHHRAFLLDQRQTFEQHGGLLRFGIKRSHANLRPWPLVADEAGTPRSLQQSLERTGIEKGSDPREWFGILGGVSVEEVEVVQIMMDYGEWFEIDRRG